MKIQSARHIGCATELESCPQSNLPEFAFVGRSNVGKSSLINTLAEVKGLAKISSTPGKTKLIHFFRINELWTLVDLPGYGFAKLSKVKQAEFNKNVSHFLNGRSNLKQVFALIDSQLEPLDSDLAFVDWLQECDIPYAIILTKIDRSTNSKVSNNEGKLIKALHDYGLRPTKIFKCSAKTKKGRSVLLNWIESHLPRVQKKKKRNAIQLEWMKK